MTKKFDIWGDGPRSSVLRPAPWLAVAGVLLVPVALALLKPAQPLSPPAAMRPALSTAPAPVRSAPAPTPAVTQPADPTPSTPSQATVNSSPAALHRPAEQTLYLTIVGDRIYRVMGPVSGRPPRVDQLMTPVNGQSRTTGDTGGSVPDQPGAGFVIADHEQPAPPLGPEERPLGPAPQECPKTLPPGTDQATVDGLRRQSGCRYLSSCTVDTNECTFFYQGRG